jgi:peptide deformylase
VASKYKIITYGNPALRKKATPIKSVDAAIRKLAKDMLDTMYASKGVGLAAQQVGRTEAICVIDVPPQRVEGSPGSASAANDEVPMPLIMINPQIEATVGLQTGDEGCLSFPEIFVRIKRAEEVTVSFLNLHNKAETARLMGLAARAVQHELDHLKGVLLVDRMSVVQKIGVAGKLKRLKKQAAAE